MQHLALAGALEIFLEFHGAVKMVFDRPLSAPRDNDHVLDPGLTVGTQEEWHGDDPNISVAIREQAQLFIGLGAGVLAERRMFTSVPGASQASSGMRSVREMSGA
jgi:hypothetical protein